ncbi:MAG: hypothetical protein AAF646_14450 [Pseudomonadota bacterium]
MAQAPATPKAKRALMLIAALFSTQWARGLQPAPSEAAALDARHRALPPVTDPVVVFLIPLVGRHHVDDWSAVSDRLNHTLKSFRRQTSPRWRALICGQDRPNGLLETSQIQFLPFTEMVEGNDKWRKLEHLCNALPTLGIPSGYAMPFDADDLIAPHVVDEMMMRRDHCGYLVERGFVHDASTGGWARAMPRGLRHPKQKAFWKLCGSCAAFAFDFRRDQQDATLLARITAHEHRMFPYLATLSRRALTPLRAGAALYIINHGENFGVRRGRVGFKTRFVEHFALQDADEIARLNVTFGLPKPNKRSRPKLP